MLERKNYFTFTHLKSIGQPGSRSLKVLKIIKIESIELRFVSRGSIPVRKANSCEHVSSRSREHVRRTRNRIVLMPFKLIELENEPM